MSPKGVNEITNTVDPAQTAWSEFTLFAQTCLSETLGSLTAWRLMLSVFDCIQWASTGGFLLLQYYSVTVHVCLLSRPEQTL